MDNGKAAQKAPNLNRRGRRANGGSRGMKGSSIKKWGWNKARRIKRKKRKNKTDKIRKTKNTGEGGWEAWYGTGQRRGGGKEVKKKKHRYIILHYTSLRMSQEQGNAMIH